MFGDGIIPSNVKAGYLEGLQMVQAIGAIEIEKNRLFVAFNCKPETVI